MEESQTDKQQWSMKHISLFSGIGGFDLAAEWMGWENVAHCEWNPFGRRVLKYYWPYAVSYEDITKTDFSLWRGRIDILTGGFPCQPYSHAGKRKGKEDERHLWPEMLRAIREIQPRWVVGENVLGLVNWNGGLVFHEVQADLENEGYEVQAYVLPACAVNAPHRRDRVWFVAHSNRYGHNGKNGGRPHEKAGDEEQVRKKDCASRKPLGTDESLSENGIFDRHEGSTSDTKHIGWGKVLHDLQREQSDGKITNSSHEQTDWSEFPTQSPICSGDDGLPRELDGITFPKWRAESIKAGGNAIVPQVALQIFKAIEQFEQKALY